MKKYANLFVLVTLAALVIVLVVNAAAPEKPTAAVSAADPTSLEPVDGNYCQECHSAGDPRLAMATAWDGGVDRNQAGACPAAATIREELYYTERLLLAVERGIAGLPAADTEKLQGRLAGAQESYQRLLDEPVTSLDAFQSGAQMLRYSLGKVYTQVNDAVTANLERRILIAAALVSLVILLSLAWGYRNSQKAIALRPAPPARTQLRPGVVLGVLLVFALFALPIIRVTEVEATVSTAQQQEIQTILDASSRTAGAAGRAQARVWMLGRVGAAWSSQDAAAGAEALQASRDAGMTANLNSTTAWGERQSAVEASAGYRAETLDAALVTADLVGAYSRTWGLRRAAEDTAERDPQLAVELLSESVKISREAQGIYRDLDLRAAAVVWAKIDPAAGLAVVRTVQDPAIRSWGLREIAALGKDTAIYAEAAAAAREIEDPLRQANALAETGASGGGAALFTEAAAVLSQSTAAPSVSAFARAHLAVSAGDAGLLSCDSAGQAGYAACAAAFRDLGDFQSAWEYALKLSDPYEQARAQASIAAVWGEQDRAGQIALQPLRERALRDLSISLQDAGLLEGIASPYLRVQAFSALGDYTQAWETAGSLTEKYPLVGLILAQTESDPQGALQAVELLKKEADKSVVLTALSAAQPQNEALFERALGMALAARVRNDAAAPVQASLDLAFSLEKTNPAFAARAFTQAYEVAQAISIK